MVAALLFWQRTDLLHFWNYTRRFIVNSNSDEVLGDHRRQSQETRLAWAGFQPLISKGEQSGLQTRIGTENVSLCMQMNC
jgi:hypothetical protein